MQLTEHNVLPLTDEAGIIEWPEFIASLAPFGLVVTESEVRDPQWAFKYLAHTYGVSIIIRHQTADDYMAQVRSIGKANPDSGFIQSNRAAIAAHDGIFSYRLVGGRYTDQSHASPLTPDFGVCILTALYNAVRDHYQDRIEAGPMN